MKRCDVTLEHGDVEIIRKFLEFRVKSYVAEWNEQQCLAELTNWLYNNTYEDGE